MARGGRRLRRALWWALLLVSLLPALLLSVVRALDPWTARLVLVESFTPLALPLYALLLLLALGALPARLRGRGPGAARLVVPVLLVALAASGLVVHGAWFSARVTGTEPSPAVGARALTVMQANVFLGPADGGSLVRTAAEQQVDVLVLEEVTTVGLASMDRAGLGDLFPHRIGRPHRSDPGGTLVLSRTPLGPPERLGTAYDGWQVEVQGITLLAVHPDFPLDPAQWRADHAAILRAALDSDADLVVGDFNATLDHRPMRDLVGSGLRSAAELTNEGWQPTWPAGGEVRLLGVPVPSLLQIDHVLVGPRLAVVSTRTVDLVGSDHRGLVVRVARR